MHRFGRVSAQLCTVVVLAIPGACLAQALPGATSEAVAIQRPPGQLAGTLVVPRAGGPLPVVLLIAGSGPTDRDGNGSGLRPASLQQLAESLATRGIATFRFDKRGIAGSSSAAIPENQLTLETEAADVAAWMEFLAKDKRFTGIIVAGHSEGALLGLLSMHQEPAMAYISLDGPARPANEIPREQLANKLPASLMEQNDSILARLKRGVLTDSLPTALAGLYRPSVQPYLASWFKYSGARELAGIKVPCLIVQGTHDLQVAPSEADLLHSANARCQVARIDGMNHVLKLTPADMQGQLPSYQGPDAPLATGLVNTIASLIGALKR